MPFSYSLRAGLTSLLLLAAGRGPRRDGVSTETGLLQRWPAAGPSLAFSNDRGDGPRSTPTIDDGRVYAFGSSGDMTVLDAATGKVAWTQNLLQKFGGSNIQWGLSESPLVLDDRILVTPGGRNAAIVALRKTDGSVIWQSQSDRPGYSSAVVHTIGGVRQAIVFSGSRALGVDVNDGRLLWSYNQVANNVANIATPIARGNHVFLSSDYGTGAALLSLTAAGKGVTASEVYFTREMRNHHASSILIGIISTASHRRFSRRCASTRVPLPGGIAAWARVP